jgi:hypothetical protein
MLISLVYKWEQWEKGCKMCNDIENHHVKYKKMNMSNNPDVRMDGISDMFAVCPSQPAHMSYIHTSKRRFPTQLLMH